MKLTDNVRRVSVAFHDEPQRVFETLVSVDGAWNGLDEEDDGVFFYFASVEEFESARDANNGFEFRIVEDVNA